MRSEEAVYVLDATPIIHFAKVNRINLVLGICKAYMTKEVYKETVERGQGRADSLTIRDALERREMEVYDVRNTEMLRFLQRHAEMHLGEAETLAATKELDAFAVIDEAEARAVAKTYDIKTRAGTLFLLFKLLALGKIRVTEAEGMLDELVASGLYIDSRTLIKAKHRIKSMGIWQQRSHHYRIRRQASK